MFAEPPPLLIHHTDQGSEYAADKSLQNLKERAVLASMSARGDCWDNAVSESFFGSLKSELVHRRVWPTRDAAQSAIGDYAEGFYNRPAASLDSGLCQPSRI
jgi:putative transposase